MSHKSILLASSAVVTAVLLAMVAVLVGTAGPAEAAFPGKNGAIAFVAEGGEGSQNAIGRINPDGSGRTKLTDTEGILYGAPKWSANGRKILFNFCSGPEHETCTGEVRRMNANGTGEVTLTATHDWWPSWFPTWNRIVFTHWGGRPEGFGIYAMTFDASGEEKRATLLTNNGDCPVVSPDGTKIAFHSYRGGERGLWVMRAVPEGPANQPLRIASGMDFNCYTYDWSPDGKKIAYSQSSDVFVINADGTDKINVTETPDVSESSPAFSPNGKKIAFSSYRDGRGGIWKMGTDGSDPIRIPNSGGAGYPDWQPLP